MSPTALACRCARALAVSDVVEQREHLLLVLGGVNGRRLTERVLEALVRQLGLQPADRDLLAAPWSSSSAPRVNRRPSIISSSAVNDSGVAVVRGRAQEQPVLALVGQLPRRDRALAVHGVAAAADRRGRARRRDMVRLVDHEHVEREPLRGLSGCPTWRVHVAQQPLGAQLSAATPC